MNTFIVTRQLNGIVTIRVVSQDHKHIRNLNTEEINALNGLLNEAEFEQHLSQQPISNPNQPDIHPHYCLHYDQDLNK